MMFAKRWIHCLNQLFESADARTHLRLKADFRAILSGSFGKLEVTGIDANRDGVGVQSPDPLPEGTLIFIRIAELGVMGFAHVRHCSPHQRGYLLGLRFREALSRDRSEGGNWTHHQVDSDGYRCWDEVCA